MPSRKSNRCRSFGITLPCVPRPVNTVCVVFIALSLIALSRCRCAYAQGAGLAGIDKHLGVEWLGLYMQGKKAGYGRASLEKVSLADGLAYRFTMKVVMKVKLMGMAQETTALEQKDYDRSGKLVAASAEMRTIMAGQLASHTKCAGRVQGGKMILNVTSGTATTTKTLDAPAETLEDHLAASRLAERGSKIGDTVKASVFEVLLLRSLDQELKVVAKKKILFNGVETEVTEIEGLIPELGIVSMSYVDSEGRLLESKFGGVFVLRLESEAQAKDVTVSFDSIRINVVAVDQPIAYSHEVREMTVEIEGLDNPQTVLNTPRQHYAQLGPGRYRLHARVDDVSGLKPVALPVSDARFAADLEATPFFQCDHPKIQAQAREIVAGTKHAWPAAKRLSSWVWATLEKVGTAAWSNAVETLESKRGDCTEHTALFVALARAAGIPARPCTGLIYWQQGGGFGYHQWASVYVGKWIEIDPTFNQPVADGTHIKFAEGDWSQSVRIISLMGKLKIRVVETK